MANGHKTEITDNYDNVYIAGDVWRYISLDHADGYVAYS